MPRKGQLKDIVGEVYTSNQGDVMKIVERTSALKCNVMFEDGSIVKDRYYANVVKGKVYNPKHRIGEQHITKEDYEFEIIEFTGDSKFTIKFKTGLVLQNVYYNRIKSGNIKNPYHPSVFGVGFDGIGKHKTSIKGLRTKHYICWRAVLQRCYSEVWHQKQPTYRGCTVDESWHNFQVFAEFYEKNYKEGFEIDKDILLKGNKHYSAKTCRFVPKRINSLFIKKNANRGEYPIGVTKESSKFLATLNKKRLCLLDTPEQAFECYKVHKEVYIKEIADEWKNRIDLEIYQALMNYKVEITD